MMPYLRLFACFLAFPFFGAKASVLQLDFFHRFNHRPLLLDSLRYKNNANEQFSITRLSYLLSNFSLLNENDLWITLPNQFALIDLSRGLTSVQLTDLPPGLYSKIRFDIGLDPSSNLSDPAQYQPNHPLNPVRNNLHWSWQSGYIFLAFEGRFLNGASPSGFVYHLANDWNRLPITLSAPIDLTLNASLEIEVALDAFFDASQHISLSSDGASSHSAKGDPLIQKFTANLPSAFIPIRSTQQDPSTTQPSPSPIDLPASFTPFPLSIGKHFPIPSLPLDNPLTTERVALGKSLFFDPILSKDGSIACFNCHRPENSFSDPRKQSIGIQGALTRRHSMPLINLAWKNRFFWDGRAPSLRAQVLHPIQDPSEMGANLPALLAKLAESPAYPAAFSRAFKSGQISSLNLSLALEAYLLTLIALDAPFDQAIEGTSQLTPLEQRGFQLFFTEYEPRSGKFGADCFHCHGGPLFTDNQFHDNGLAISSDFGLFESTGLPSDKFKFATPSLRNLTRTAPYMHDGRFQSLEEVIAHYNGPLDPRPSLDPNLAKHPRTGLNLSPEDQSALIAYLKSLSTRPPPPPPFTHF